MLYVSGVLGTQNDSDSTTGRQSACLSAFVRAGAITAKQHTLREAGDNMQIMIPSDAGYQTLLKSTVAATLQQAISVQLN